MIQVDKIVGVLKAETRGLISGRMLHKDCGHVGKCAIGALLLAAGITPATIKVWGQTGVWISMYSVLLANYGLRKLDADNIMSYNDTCFGMEDPFTPSKDCLNLIVEYVRDLAQQEKNTA